MYLKIVVKGVLINFAGDTHDYLVQKLLELGGCLILKCH